MWFKPQRSVESPRAISSLDLKLVSGLSETKRRGVGWGPLRIRCGNTLIGQLALSRWQQPKKRGANTFVTAGRLSGALGVFQCTSPSLQRATPRAIYATFVLLQT